MIERGEATLAFLQERFHTVFFVPGNPLRRNHRWGVLAAASVGLAAGTARPGIYPRANRQSDYS